MFLKKERQKRKRALLCCNMKHGFPCGIFCIQQRIPIGAGIPQNRLRRLWCVPPDCGMERSISHDIPRTEIEGRISGCFAQGFHGSGVIRLDRSKQRRFAFDVFRIDIAALRQDKGDHHIHAPQCGIVQRRISVPISKSNGFSSQKPFRATSQLGKRNLQRRFALFIGRKYIAAVGKQHCPGNFPVITDSIMQRSIPSLVSGIHCRLLFYQIFDDFTVGFQQNCKMECIAAF